MAQKKLLRFAQLKTFSNVLESPSEIAGHWNDFFKNKFPITLELACGRGEYTVGLSRMYPLRNFIGIDIKGNRMFIGAKQALYENLTNAAFLRIRIENLPACFTKDEVEQIWITFPDPQLRASKAKKRLTHPRFLRLYQHVLKPGGHIHLKTDSTDLYDFTKTVIHLYGLKIVRDIQDVYAGNNEPDLTITTHYESLDIAQSRKVFYLQFSLPDQLPLDDAELNKVLHEQKASAGR